MDPASMQMLAQAGAGITDVLKSFGQTGLNYLAQKKMADYQYQKDVEMWNRQNEYNSPAAQMKRISDAGLNPNLVFGSGVSGNTSSQLPKYQAPSPVFNLPETRPIDVLGTLSSYQDVRIKQAQYDNLQETNKQLQLRNAGLDLQNRFGLETFEDRVTNEYGKRLQSQTKGMEQGLRYEVLRKNLEAYEKSQLSKWQTDVLKQQNYQAIVDSEIRLRQESTMQKYLGNLLNKVGLNWSDDPGLRQIGFIKSGQNTKGISPYVIGSSVIDKVGRVIPRINFNTNKSRTTNWYDNNTFEKNYNR